MIAFLKVFDLVPGWLFAAICAACLAVSCVEHERRQMADNKLHTVKAEIAEERRVNAEAARNAEAEARTEESRRNSERELVIQKAQNAKD